MLTETAVELWLWRGIEAEEARPTTRGHRTPNIDRPFAIRKRDRTITGEVTLVVDRVDTRTLKPVDRREGIAWAQQQRPAHAPTKLNAVQRIEGMLADAASLIPLSAVAIIPEFHEPSFQVGGLDLRPASFSASDCQSMLENATSSNSRARGVSMSFALISSPA